MEDAPSAEDVAAWLKSLEDRDVLARMGKLQFTSDYDEDIMLSNFDVLEGMRNDSRRFAGEELQ